MEAEVLSLPLSLFPVKLLFALFFVVVVGIILPVVLISSGERVR